MAEMIDRKRRPLVVIWLLPLFVGLVGFDRVAKTPGFAAMRNVDIIQLLGCGACFGSVMLQLSSRW